MDVNVVKKEIEESIKLINSQLSRLDDLYQEKTWYQYEYRESSSIEVDLKIEDLQENYSGTEFSINHELFNIRIRLLLLFESINYKSIIDLINELYFNDEINTIDYYNYAGVFTSPKLYKFESVIELYNSHQNLIESSNFYSELVLDRMLKSTGFIVINSGLVPKSENDVQKLIYDHIRVVFPDTVRESSIPKVSKIFKPDFSIKSLSTCVEIKYVTNLREARNILGGIYEDIHGYSGYKDWTRFIAVIYMTEPFITEEQIDAELQMSSIPESWKYFLVIGKGTRK